MTFSCAPSQKVFVSIFFYSLKYGIIASPVFRWTGLHMKKDDKNEIDAIVT